MIFSVESVREIANSYYGIDCKVKPLAGDVDYNFCLTDNIGKKFLLKICKPEVSADEIDFQLKILRFLDQQYLRFAIPKILPTHRGDLSFVHRADDTDYTIRMHSWVDGRMLSDVNPRREELFFQWGEVCGQLSTALNGFDHPGAHRFDKWNPVETLYSRKYVEYFENEDQQEIANYFWRLFEKEALPIVPVLRKSVNYSDAHEHNILTELEGPYATITGIIDFGDAIFAPTICELAIACAYAGMYQPNPIQALSKVVEGYHSAFAITEEELSILFPLICGRLMITVSNAAYKMAQEPDNKYQQVSAKPAWDLLRKLRNVSPQFAHYSFRDSCSLNGHPNHEVFYKWISENGNAVTAPILLKGKSTMTMDLSVGSLDLGGNSNFETITQFTLRINEILRSNNADVGIGGYGEIRPFYTTDAYKVEGNNGPQWRTMHLGTDYWTDEDTEVLACCDGVVHALKNNDNPCDYGPTIILKHIVNDSFHFYSLYGHLNTKTLSHLKIGQEVKKGEVIAWIGHEEENGQWPPHLHFQLMLDLLGNEGDFPGVGYVSESEVWLSICPSLPDTIVGDVHPAQKIGNIQDQRKKVLGRSLSVSYEQPLHMVRGAGIYLYDTTGRRYMDTVNNVAHVGHEHPRVVRAAQRQMEVLNTNTRYLHENIVSYAEALLSNCPEEMDVVYFVNSGSEANELALRMAKIYSKQQDIIALEAGYHGNTGACIDISSYKFDGKGGKGAPEYTSICSMPDLYRGKYKDPSSAGHAYAKDIKSAIENIKKKDRNVAGFIAESILSCGGQIVLPPNYLKECYSIVRAEGGVCITDEVQVGFGRVGEHFWAFELQDVVPDIITCGKPIGNGHPLAAVITTRRIAEAFTNGMEYFNTFGGNPVSCAIGHEILKVIQEENLQQNAKEVGSFLQNGLTELKQKYEVIGDVRGIGLFLGIELIKDKQSLTPAPEQATYLVNRMRELGILMSTDGPLHNVIKIKPPMCITKENAAEILKRLDAVLAEDFMKC